MRVKGARPPRHRASDVHRATIPTTNRAKQTSARHLIIGPRSRRPRPGSQISDTERAQGPMEGPQQADDLAVVLRHLEPGEELHAATKAGDAHLAVTNR